MNNVIVVYTSETGFSQKYARWIGEELGCDAVKSAEVTKEKLVKSDVIIYGGGFYAGQIKGLKKFKEILGTEDLNKLAVFATGATPGTFTETIEKALDQNFTEEERNMIPAFYFQSGLNYENMSFKSKMLMKMFSSMMAKKKDKTEEEEVMAKNLSKSSDLCRREYILPLTEHVKTLRSVDCNS